MWDSQRHIFDYLFKKLLYLCVYKLLCHPKLMKIYVFLSYVFQNMKMWYVHKWKQFVAYSSVSLFLYTTVLSLLFPPVFKRKQLIRKIEMIIFS